MSSPFVVQLVTSNVGDLGSVPALGRPPGEWKGYRLQCSGLENSMDCIVTKSQTRLHDFDFDFPLVSYLTNIAKSKVM